MSLPRFPSFHILILTFFATLLLLALLPSSSTAQPQPPPVSYTDLVNEQPVIASLPANATAYYRFTAATVSYSPTALFSVSATTGFPALYVSLTDPVPSVTSFDYTASYTTGGVVSVVQSTPYTVYLAVQASPYSACNYTIVGTSYDPATHQLTATPLPDAEPLASAIAAGEYRYYTYTVNAADSTQQVTVSLTETYGQSYLYINSPNTTALPTVSSSQYSSTSATFPLVVLPTPQAGVWTIGVWSNASSVFSIIAVTNTDIQPMQLGVTYPGAAARGTFVYYSVYVDPLLLPTSSTLSIDLFSLTGDADIYCSDVTERPINSNSRWASINVRADDHISVLTSQLQGTTVYCGVNGFAASNYVVTASYGNTYALTAGETTVAHSPAGGTQYYTLTFPAVDAFISLSVQSDVGTTALTVSRYGVTSFGAAIMILNAAQSQLVQTYTSRVCGANNAFAIPGSSPPLCQMVVIVNTPTASVYRIVASIGAQFVALTAGESLDWALNANQTTAHLSFTIPDNLSNVTLMVTVTDGSSGMTLSVGQSTSASFTPLWTVTQQPGSDVLVFQLDYTSQGLPQGRSLKGEYTVQISTTSDVAAFSVLYTVTNASGLSTSIVELADGRSQEGVVSALGYNFYFYQPSLEGWPYAVRFSVSWVSGTGSLRYQWSNGARLGPTATEADTAITGSGAIVPDSNLLGSCTPSATVTCGFSLSVQGEQGLSQPGVYVITVASARSVRTLLIRNTPMTSAVLQPSASEYWATSANVAYGYINPQVMYGLQVLSGSVAVYASNTTASPNATTAQLTWRDLTSTAVLAFPARAGSNTYIQLAVLCSSTDGTPCQYEIRAQLFDESLGPDGSSAISNPPTVVLLPANGLSFIYFGVGVNQFTSLAYINMQASALIGSVSLYVSCLASGASYSLLPNETTASWRAVTAPIAIELTNFTVSDSCYNLVLGVRAGSDQAAWVETSVSAAGVVRTGYGSTYGLSTPAFPLSYYTIQQTTTTRPLVLSVTHASSACTTSQLQMVLSDAVQLPDPSNPATYNYSATAVTLPTGVTDMSIAFTQFAKPKGSFHVGTYYVAVRSVAGTTCDYRLDAFSVRERTLSFGQLSQVTAYESATSLFEYVLLSPVLLNTSTSIAVQLYGSTGKLLLYVGVNSSPAPSNPSTYLLTALYDTTSAGAASSLYTAQPIYLPATACTAMVAAGQPCTVVIRAFSSASSQNVQLKAMTSASAVVLVEQQPSALTNSTALATTYQFTLPASPLSVTVSVNATTAVSVFCSYRYVTPDSQFHEWQTASTANMSAATVTASTTGLTFTWDASLQTNTGSVVAAAATTCYCTVQATSFDAYSIHYATAPLPETSHQLSGGALIAAIVVPIVAVILIAIVLAWQCRGRLGCCDAAGKSRSEGRTSQRLDESVQSREVSMAELSTRSGVGGGNGQLMSGGVYSDVM